MTAPVGSTGEEREAGDPRPAEAEAYWPRISRRVAAWAWIST